MGVGEHWLHAKDVGRIKLGNIRTLGHMNPLSPQTKQYFLHLGNSNIYIHLIPLNNFIMLIKLAYTHLGISEGMIIHLFKLY